MDKNQYSSQEQQIETTKDGFLKNGFHESKFAIELPDLKEKMIASVNLAHGLTFLLQIGRKRVRHITRNGNLLYEREFNRLITSVMMIDSKNALILLESVKQEPEEIVGFNLENYSSFSFKFVKQIKGACEMLLFTDSKLICIKEDDLKSIKLTYYKYQNSLENSFKIEEHPIYLTNFKYESNHICKKHKVVKINNRSMVAIFKQKAQKKDLINLFIYDPQKDDKNINKYTFSGSLQTTFHFTDFWNDNEYESAYLFRITDIWEYKPDILLVKYESYVQDIQIDLPMKLPSTQEEIIRKFQKYYEFLWQYTQQSYLQVKMLKMIPNHIHYTHLRGQSLNLLLQIHLKKYFHSIRKIRTNKPQNYCPCCQFQADYQEMYNLLKSEPLEYQIPIYFMNGLKKSETAVEFENFQTQITQQMRQILYYAGDQQQFNTQQAQRIVSVPYNPSFFLQYWEQKIAGQVITLNITLKIMKQLKYSLKIITAFFVDEFIEKCDEDLLYCTVGLIQDSLDEMSYHRFD